MPSQPPAVRNSLTTVVGKDNAKKLRMTRKKAKTLKKLGGEFSRDIPDIFTLLDSNDNDTVQVQVIFLKSALATVVDLIPYMEDQARKSRREQDAYALNSLISQGREIFSDLRSLSDTDKVADRISISVVDPMFTALSHTFINLIATLRDSLVENCKEDEYSKQQIRLAIQTCATSFGEYLNVSSSTMKESIRKQIE